MSTQPKNGSIAFQPRARLLKLIGEELISDEVVALSELVKNSHDADAASVTVTFRGVANTDGGHRGPGRRGGHGRLHAARPVDGTRRQHEGRHGAADHGEGPARAGGKGCRAVRGRQTRPLAGDCVALRKAGRRGAGGRGLGPIRHGFPAALGSAEPLGGPPRKGHHRARDASADVGAAGDVVGTDVPEAEHPPLASALAVSRERPVRHPDRVGRVPPVFGGAAGRLPRQGTVPGTSRIRRPAGDFALAQRSQGRDTAVERPGRTGLRPGQGPAVRLRPRRGGDRPGGAADGGQGVAPRVERGQYLPRRFQGLAVRGTARRLAAPRPAAGEQSRGAPEQQPGHRVHRHRPRPQPGAQGPDQPRGPDPQPALRRPSQTRVLRSAVGRGRTAVDPPPGPQSDRRRREGSGSGTNSGRTGTPRDQGGWGGGPGTPGVTPTPRRADDP